MIRPARRNLPLAKYPGMLPDYGITNGSGRIVSEEAANSVLSFPVRWNPPDGIFIRTKSPP